MGDNMDALLGYLAKCGLSVAAGDGPDTLLLRGPKQEKTAAVLAAVKKHKAELVRRFAPEKPVAVPEKPLAPVTAEIEAKCERCRALIFFPAAADGVFCLRTDCPQVRLGTLPQAESVSGWKRCPPGKTG